MMSKRRRASSVASRGADGDESDDALDNPGPPPSTRKKKKLDPGEMCQQLYDTIRSYKKEDGTPLCDSFIRAPKRRQEPQYYEVVSQPIDLLRVQQKLKTDTYEDIEELSADIELLVNNAKAFYKPDSVEYKDAIELWSLYTRTKQALENGEDIKAKQGRTGSVSRRSDNAEEMSETSTNYEGDSEFEELFNAVMSAHVDGRPLYTAFQFLPSKRLYPEYYDVIETPIDLKTIAQKIQAGDYSTLNDLEKDLQLMVRNACHFNEPGSQIYKAAKTLKKVITTRKQEIDQHGRGHPAKTSERIRSKRTSRAAPAPSSSALAIMEPPDSDAESEVKHSEESGAESDEEKADNEDSPQWKLLETIRNHPGPDGSPMSTAFLKLPSRRFYPDYYKEIKNPVSLNQIRNKIRRGAYGTLSEVAGDMNIMFENAKQYNINTSKLYKNAVKLQRLMQQRVQELLELAQSSSSDDESLSSVKSQAQANTPRPRGRPRNNPLPPNASSPVHSPLMKHNLPLKKKLHAIAKYLLEYTCSDGRQPMLLFMEKPSKKLYPHYYNVIEKPIDMITIESNIKNDRYSSIDEMVSDFRLMFANCRQFNEEGSMVYEDANLLERALTERLRGEGKTPATSKNSAVKVYKATKRSMGPHEQKLRSLYDAIRDFRDPKANRQLALIFMKLPSKTEYPDYYELIKNPIDMEKIAHKLKNQVYKSVNELASDFVLMFDNACKYNEPDSQIYKDALTLQRVCLQTKQTLRDDDDTVPDVPAAVQELLVSLFTTVYNHQDDEGRCFSDSMAELPEHDESMGGERVRAISLDLVKRRLDKGLYKRLDHFQTDMFAVFERARRLSRTDSQIFEDAVELQSYYIEQRDKLCAGTLQSPALSFTKELMTTSIELVKQCKLLQENTDEDETRSSTDESMPAGGTALQHAQYLKGDFVYLQPDKGKKESPIVQVERVWTNNEGVPMMYANVYFRPHETFHVRTRKFLPQEVFKTETHRTAPLDTVAGQCYVMNVKDYFKFKPEGYADKDVYVCESRYSTRYKTFKKIKLWEGAEKEATLVPRDVPLEPLRSVSVFRERVEKHRDELAELEVLEHVQEKERPDIQQYNPMGTDDENTYYEQYNTVCSGVVKTGDYVVVVTDGGKQLIAQVDTIWETGDNKGYFRGPFLIFPSEVANIINKPFYKQEVLLTTMHDTSPLVGIIGKCAVLDYEEYLKCRPTEIPESDVFVCESLYDESNRVARKLKSGLRKFEHSKDVTVDEIYYFPKRLGPPPLASAQEVQSVAYSGKSYNSNADMDAKPQFTALINTTIGSQDVEMILENSLDESSLASPATPLSIGGNSNPYNPSMSATPSQDRFSATPTPASKKKKEQKQKIVTGYILYSSEVRKAIIANNPESTFGEISRIVGNEWRSLPASTKQSWEERAAKCNEETSAKLADEMRELTQHPSWSKVMEMTYECQWDTCDLQFEELSDCMEHCVGDCSSTATSSGHVQTHYRGSHTEYPCLWRNCARVRKGQAPFPNLARLVKHVRDLHINKSNGKPRAHHERARNFVPSSKKPQKQYTAVRSGVMSPGGSLSAMSPACRDTPSPSEAPSFAPRHAPPLFVTAPPRSQRLQHSDAYIRYIEGLHSDQKYITPWEKSLTPMPLNPDPAHFNMSKLPAHWMTEDAVNGYLAQDKSLSETDIQKMDQNTKVLKGLCALRDFMMRDAFNIHKHYNIST
ncbi:protein polybromo-1 isoform X3 [Plutella xylostella]|uniref:protein polybromo-1 isoform X1 n=1 Tax=Plutella xylostella TaxID=51655 RepID=UPI00203272AB|nr:protein polybromo-1 isoform X1 [Plutella xylostella]XP_048486477.1 protein polybromo-1 isoform X2 [Plutella xylostella]XP_048486478.1 protein polybromo-1 isoform X3 [Plutella xylostella]